MISLDEAIGCVLKSARPGPAEPVSLREALGLVLAEDVASDADSPPCDSSRVDGYAVMSADFNRRPIDDSPFCVELAVIEEVAAGMAPGCRLGTGRAVRVAAGVPLPEGANAVVPFQQAELLEEPFVPLGVFRYTGRKVAEGQNVLPRGARLRKGELAVASGTRIGPVEIGRLAEAGRSGVRVVPRPHVALLSVGNDLIDAEFFSAGGKMRNTGGPMLAALTRQSGGRPTDLGIGRDEPESLRPLLSKGLDADMLVISGGPDTPSGTLLEVLRELGTETAFCGVSLEPGGAMWFGIQRGDAGETMVFGLPQDTVGCLVCFGLFVAPAVRALAGRGDGLSIGRAVLAASFQHDGAGHACWPSRLHQSGQTAIVEPVRRHASGGLRNLIGVNALVVFPPPARDFAEGEEVDVVLL